MNREIIAGFTLRFEKIFEDYPANIWSLSYSLVNKDNAYTFDAIADGNKFVINVPGTITETWAPGTYQYFAHVTDGTDRFLAESGTVEILPDPTSGAYDTRSHAKKVLDAIEAVIEGRATHDQASYTIGGIQISKMRIDELLTLRNKYLIEYQRELQAEKVAQGLKAGNKVYVRFK